MKALETFFDKEEPMKVNMRAKNCHQVIYILGDASGDGSGDSFLMKNGLSYHIGIKKKKKKVKPVFKLSGIKKFPNRFQERRRSR